MRDSLVVTIFYVLGMWALLAIFAEPIASLFGAEGEARDLILFFCYFAAGSFLFYGAIFVSAAAFNNLGYPTYSTVFNWGRSTLGVIPFVWVGAKYYGAEGVLAGWALGAVVFGVVSMVVCFRVIGRISSSAAQTGETLPASPSAANSPFSTEKASTLD
jgi:Na+-driven multidrug efflux pump